MSTQHYCDKGGGWVDGTVVSCPKHNKNGRKLHVFKSAQQKRAADKAGGTRGVQRGNYIHGPEGG